MQRFAVILALLFLGFGMPGTAEQLTSYLNSNTAELNQYALEIVDAKGNGVSFYGGDQTGPESPFNNGSLAKVFTALLTARLAEKNLLAYDRQIGDGISLEQVLTHTSGLQQRGFGTAQTVSGFIPPRSRHLRQFAHLPPGEGILYSSPAFSLIETAIEQATGDSFEKVMAEELFLPLGLADTNYGPLPSPAAGRNKNGNPYPEYKTLLPASGNIVSSPRDMAALLKMLLSDRADFLSSASIDEMMRLRTTHGDPHYGRSLAFQVKSYNGIKILSHDGAAPGTNARLLLIPRLGKGFYFVYNSNSYDPKNDVTAIILKSLLGLEQPPESLRPVHSGDLDDVFEGWYIPLSNSLTTIEKINTLLGQVRLHRDKMGFSAGDRSYSLQKGGIYYRKDSAVPAGFRTIGRKTYLTIGNTLFRRAEAGESLPVQAALLALCLLGIVSVLFIPRRGKSRIIEVIYTAFFVYYLYCLATTDIWMITYGTPLKFAALSVILLILPLIRTVHMIIRLLRKEPVFIKKTMPDWISSVLMIILSLQLFQYNLIQL